MAGGAGVRGKRRDDHRVRAGKSFAVGVIYRYWPRHKPLPPGWQICPGMERTHHGIYSVLIKRIADV